MLNSIKHIVSILLIVSFVLLGVLVPGGPIETRNFSNIDPLVLAAFNIFLTSLAITSLLLIFFVLKNMRWAYIASMICGISYFFVYVLDLGSIFPVSADQMPIALLIIEIAGAIVSIPLVYVAMRGALKSTNDNEAHPVQSTLVTTHFTFIVLALIAVGIGVVVFATKSAMGN